MGAPGQPGEVDLLLGLNDLHPTLAPVLGDPLSGQTVRVPLRTLDSILAETGVTRIDFLSVDVEGMGNSRCCRVWISKSTRRNSS